MSNPHNTLRGGLSSLAVIAGALALYLSTAMIAVLLSGSPIVGAVVSNTVLFTAGLFWLHSTQHRNRTVIPVPGGSRSAAREPGFWALTALTLVFCWLVGQAASVWLYSLVGSSNFDEHASAKAEAPAVLMILVVLVLAPMGEEMLMRGVIYSRLRSHLPPLAAAVLTAGVFSLMHLNLVQIAATLPLGLLLPVVYEQTGQLAPVILMHIVFNLFSMIVPAALVAGFSSLTFVLLGGVVLNLLLARLYRPVGPAPKGGVPGSRKSGLETLAGK
jgi:uncharacterized protein